jgi:hypothetical protein
MSTTHTCDPTTPIVPVLCLAFELWTVCGLWGQTPGRPAQTLVVWLDLEAAHEQSCRALRIG